MTVITEAELREMWQSGKGSLAVLPQGTKLTPSAKDFVKDWDLKIAFEDDAPISTDETNASHETEKGQSFAAEESFAARAEQSPRYLSKGRAIIPAPVVHAPRANSPRLIIKGRTVLTGLLNVTDDNGTKALQLAKIDTLTAHFLLATAQARRFNLPELSNELARLAAFTLAIADAGRNGQAMPPLNQDSIFATQNDTPTKTSPMPETHEMLLYLNLLRAQINEVRLSAQNAQCSRVFISALDSLVDAVNRLLLQFKAGKFPWTASGWQKQSSN